MSVGTAHGPNCRLIPGGMPPLLTAVGRAFVEDPERRVVDKQTKIQRCPKCYRLLAGSRCKPCKRHVSVSFAVLKTAADYREVIDCQQCRCHRPARLSEKAAKRRKVQADRALLAQIQRVKQERDKLLRAFPPLEVWQALDKRAQAEGKGGLMIRRRALDFLQVESRVRAISDEDWAVWELEEKRCRRVEGKKRRVIPEELLAVKRSHHVLLQKEPMTMRQTARLPFVTRSRKPVPAMPLSPLECRLVMFKNPPRGQLSISVPHLTWHYFDQEGQLIWVNRTAHKDDVLRAVESIYKEARKEKRISRAKGQGRSYTLTRLAQALMAYDQWTYHDTRQKALADGRKGETLIRIAHHMMRAASAGPEVWDKEFRPQQTRTSSFYSSPRFRI